MMNKSVAANTVIFASLLALSACASSVPDRVTTAILPPLNGMIYDFDNTPVPGARIRAEATGTETTGTETIGAEPVRSAATSDVNGRFALAGLVAGPYAITVSLEGYEETGIKADYSDPTQILYVKLFSADQLLDLAERAASERNWASADEYLARAAAVRPGDPAAVFLEATLLVRKERYQDALAKLDALTASGVEDPYVYLFIADLLQFRMDDPAGSLKNLDRFREMRYDPAVDERAEKLRKELTAR